MLCPRNTRSSSKSGAQALYYSVIRLPVQSTSTGQVGHSGAFSQRNVRFVQRSRIMRSLECVPRYILQSHFPPRRSKQIRIREGLAHAESKTNLR